jgi:Fur family ferric uptake transcriptional regulator
LVNRATTEVNKSWKRPLESGRYVRACPIFGPGMSKDHITEQAESLFEAYLEQNGHRKTPERFAILRQVYAYDGHFDVDTLYEVMGSSEYRVSRATLYNTLDLLLDCNLVRRHQFGDQSAQYEKCHRIKQHDHVIFADSGEVLEFCDPRIQQIKATLEELFDIEVLHHSLNIYARKRATTPQASRPAPISVSHES